MQACLHPQHRTFHPSLLQQLRKIQPFAPQWIYIAHGHQSCRLLCRLLLSRQQRRRQWRHAVLYLWHIETNPLLQRARVKERACKVLEFRKCRMRGVAGIDPRTEQHLVGKRDLLVTRMREVYHGRTELATSGIGGETEGARGDAVGSTVPSEIPDHSKALLVLGGELCIWSESVFGEDESTVGEKGELTADAIEALCAGVWG